MLWQSNLKVQISCALHINHYFTINIDSLAAKATKMDCEQDVCGIMVVFHCLQIWINCCEEMKDHLGHSGIISNTVLLHLKLIHAFPALDEVCNRDKLLIFPCSN